MADNVPVTPSASYTVAADNLGTTGVMAQRVKVILGLTDVDGANVDVTNPFPVTGTVTAQVTGAVSVSAMPAVSGTVTVIAPAVSTVGTVLGTVAVNVVAGGAAPGTTAATQSAVTAQVVWLAPTQTISATVNTLAAGFSVNALVTGPVSISAMPGVSIVGIVPVTTAASVSVSALPVWLNPTQPVVVNTIAAGFSVNALVTGPVSVSALPAISISVSAALGTVITVLGTQVVSVVPGVSVSVAALSLTTATPSISATGAVMWLANTVTVTVTATVTGSLIISGIAVVTTAASVSVSGLPVWLNPTQGVVASISAIAASQTIGTIIAVSGVTAVSVVSTIVTMLGTAIVTAVGSPGFNAVHIEVTSTALVISATAYLFTVWTGATGAPVAAGTTAFAIPAGKTLRLLNMQAIINSSAVTGGTVNLIAVGAGATASLVSASISTQLQVMKLQVLVSAGPVAASIAGYQDTGPGVTIGIIIVASTAAQLQQAVIMGYLF